MEAAGVTPVQADSLCEAYWKISKLNHIPQTLDGDVLLAETDPLVVAWYQYLQEKADNERPPEQLPPTMMAPVVDVVDGTIEESLELIIDEINSSGVTFQDTQPLVESEPETVPGDLTHVSEEQDVQSTGDGNEEQDSDNDDDNGNGETTTKKKPRWITDHRDYFVNKLGQKYPPDQSLADARLAYPALHALMQRSWEILIKEGVQGGA